MAQREVSKPTKKLDASSSSFDDSTASKRNKTEKKENWEQVDLNHLIFSYGIKLRKPHGLPPKYAHLTEEDSNCFDLCTSFSAEDILEILLSFLVTKDILQAKAVMDEVLKIKGMQAVELLLRNKSFQPTDVKPEEKFICAVVEVIGTTIEDVQKVLAKKTTPANNKIEHESVKHFFSHFGYSMILDGTISNGMRALSLLVDYLPKAERPARKASSSVVPKKSEVVVIPDLLFGNSYNPFAVPLEVYSPHVYTKDTTCPYHGSETEDESDDEDESVTLETFLENLPPFRGPTRSVKHFQCKLTVQCLLQLLASCNEHVRSKLSSSQHISHRRRSYIGLFAHRFDLYFLKLETSPSDFCIASGTHGETTVQHPITIQYLPVPLNMCNPNHAAAFAVFLKYYRNIYSADD